MDEYQENQRFQGTLDVLQETITDKPQKLELGEMKEHVERMLAEYHKIIESQKTLKRLSRIIRALLMISKIENEQYLKKENCCIREMTGEVTGEVEERFEQKKITLESDVEEYDYRPCNKSLVHTMIFNLVNNAIKYSKEKGKITLRGRKTGRCRRPAKAA